MPAEGSYPKKRCPHPWRLPINVTFDYLTSYSPALMPGRHQLQRRSIRRRCLRLAKCQHRH